MQVKLQVDGDEYGIQLVPENEADQKLLQLVATRSGGKIEADKDYRPYAPDNIKSLKVALDPPPKPEEKETE